MPPRLNSRWFLSRWIIGLLLVITVTVVAILGWRMNSNTVTQAPEEIEDYLFWEAKELTPFTLVGAKNETFTLDDLKGRWSFIFFGYTHCPDVCPITLNVMGSAFKILQRDRANALDIQGIFVSVDPKRDTPALLKEYVTYFNAGFSGVTGNTSQVDAVTRQMGALYVIHSEGSEENYLVSHNSTIFLVDPRGRLYGRFPPPHVPHQVAETFMKIRAFYNEQEGKRWAFF